MQLITLVLACQLFVIYFDFHYDHTSYLYMSNCVHPASEPAAVAITSRFIIQYSYALGAISITRVTKLY